MKTTVNDKVLVDSSALAAAFHVTPRTVQKWAEQGKIPYYDVGRRRWFSEEDVLSALQVRR